MALEDLKVKKRKGAADAAPKSKKQKKIDETAVATKRSAKALSAAVNPIDDVDVNVKVSRKRAADFFDDDAPAEENAAKAKKGNKKSKTTAETNGDVAKATSLKADTLKVNEKAKRSTKAPKPLAKVTDQQKTKKAESHTKRLQSFEEQPDIDNAEEGEEDDQTAALLAGFESDNDENDPEEDVELDTEAKAKIDPKVYSQLEKASQKTDEPGVIYVGRIPHGFYESQMKAYFKQFGDINRLRVSRNKKTGAVKHYAFIEFASAEVADIVARTMNNYLMFGHILQCRVIPTAQVHPDLFKGAGMRFKRDPRNKKEGAAMEHGAEQAVWKKRITNEQKKRASKVKALREEMDYEYTVPSLKAVEDVSRNITSIEDSPTKQLLAEASATNTANGGLLSEARFKQSNILGTPLKVQEKMPRKSTKFKSKSDETESTTKKLDADNDVASNSVTRKTEADSDVGERTVVENNSKKTKKPPKASGTTEPKGIVRNIETAIKTGVHAVTNTPNAFVEKVEGVAGTGVDIPENESTVTDTKQRRSKKRSSSKPNAAAGVEDFVKEDDINAVPSKPETKALSTASEAENGKKNRSRKRKAATSPEAEADANDEAEVVSKDAVKEKKGKKSRKPAIDAIEGAPVQSLVGDIVDKANTSTKKVKAAKKNRQNLLTEEHDEEAPVKSIIGDVVEKAKAGTKKLRAKKASVLDA